MSQNLPPRSLLQKQTRDQIICQRAKNYRCHRKPWWGAQKDSLKNANCQRKSFWPLPGAWQRKPECVSMWLMGKLQKSEIYILLKFFMCHLKQEGTLRWGHSHLWKCIQKLTCFHQLAVNFVCHFVLERYSGLVQLVIIICGFVIFDPLFINQCNDWHCSYLASLAYCLPFYVER